MHLSICSLNKSVHVWNVPRAAFAVQSTTASSYVASPRAPPPPPKVIRDKPYTHPLGTLMPGLGSHLLYITKSSTPTYQPVSRPNHPECACLRPNPLLGFLRDLRDDGGERRLPRPVVVRGPPRRLNIEAGTVPNLPNPGASLLTYFARTGF